jgi:hypothetical protein
MRPKTSDSISNCGRNPPSKGRVKLKHVETLMGCLPPTITRFLDVGLWSQADLE